MKAFLATVLSVIAVGVLLIAYGLLAPPASAAPQVMFDPQTGMYQQARPMFANERIALPDGPAYGYQGMPVQYRHRPSTARRLHDARRLSRRAGSCSQDHSDCGGAAAGLDHTRRGTGAWPRLEKDRPGDRRIDGGRFRHRRDFRRQERRAHRCRNRRWREHDLRDEALNGCWVLGAGGQVPCQVSGAGCNALARCLAFCRDLHQTQHAGTRHGTPSTWHLQQPLQQPKNKRIAPDQAEADRTAADHERNAARDGLMRSEPRERPTEQTGQRRHPDRRP